MAWSSLLLVLAFSGSALPSERNHYAVRDKQCSWRPLGDEQAVTCKTRIIDFRSKNTSVSSIIQQADRQKPTAQLDILVSNSDDYLIERCTISASINLLSKIAELALT